MQFFILFNGIPNAQLIIKVLIINDPKPIQKAWCENGGHSHIQCVLIVEDFGCGSSTAYVMVYYDMPSYYKRGDPWTSLFNVLFYGLFFVLWVFACWLHNS